MQISHLPVSVFASSCKSSQTTLTTHLVSAATHWRQAEHVLPARLAPVPTTIAACVGRALRDSIERAHDACMRATEHLSIAIRARPTLREVGSLYAAIRIPVPVGRHIVDVHPAPS